MSLLIQKSQPINDRCQCLYVTLSFGPVQTLQLNNHNYLMRDLDWLSLSESTVTVTVFGQDPTWWYMATYDDTPFVYFLWKPPSYLYMFEALVLLVPPGNARRLRYLSAWPYGREPPFTRSTKSSEQKSFCRSQTAEDWKQICRFPIKRLLSNTGQTWLHDL